MDKRRSPIHDFKIGDLVIKSTGSDWGIVTAIVETPSFVDNRILTIHFTKLNQEMQLRAKYVKLLQKG